MKKIEISNFLKMSPSVPQYSERNQSYLIAGVDPLYYLSDGTQEEQVAPLSASIDWQALNAYQIAGYLQQNSGVNLYAGSTNKFGQSFYNQYGGSLTNVSVKLKKTGSPGGSIYVTLYAMTGTSGTDGKPTGSFLVASSNYLDASSLTTSYVSTLFTFPSYTLADNTNYVAVFSYNSGGDGSNYVTIGTSTALGDTGNASYSTNGTVWTVDNTQDMYFSVFGGGAVSTILDGNIVHMVSDTSSTYEAYAVTDTGHVYGFTSSAITDIGSPHAVSSDVGCRLAISGAYLYETQTNQSTVYYYPLAGGSWSSFGSITSSTGGHLLETFQEYVAITDTANAVQSNLVKLIATASNTILSAPILSIGNGWGIQMMRNFNNKYLAIAVGQNGGGTTAQGYPQNNILLWDGVYNTFNYSVKVPGKFIDMKVIDSVLYVAVQVSERKTCLYYMKGTQLVKIMTPQVSTINPNSYGSLFPCSLFDFRNYVGMNLNSITTDINTYYPIMIYGKDEMGEIEYIHSSGRNFDQFVTGYSGKIFANVYVNVGTSVIYFLPTVQSIPAYGYQNILYKSQWIPVKNPSAIDIEYDTPPQSGTDAINITIYGRGEDIIMGTSTTTLTPITPTNILNNSRTRLTLSGFTGDRMKIVLTTTNRLWKPIIRKISVIVV